MGRSFCPTYSLGLVARLGIPGESPKRKEATVPITVTLLVMALLVAELRLFVAELRRR